MNKLSGKGTLNIGGKKRPFKFGTNASMLYCEARNVTLNEMMEELNDEKLMNNQITGAEIRDLLWSALIAGHRSDKLPEEDEPSQWEVGDWIDEMTEADWKKFFAVLNPQVKASNDSTKKKN